MKKKNIVGLIAIVIIAAIIIFAGTWGGKMSEEECISEMELATYVYKSIAETGPKVDPGNWKLDSKDTGGGVGLFRHCSHYDEELALEGLWALWNATNSKEIVESAIIELDPNAVFVKPIP